MNPIAARKKSRRHVFASSRRKEAGGFTLMELVVVIVILGVLAAVALPRFIGMGTDARIAAVKSGVGAVNVAANLAFMKCTLATCGVSQCAGNSITAPDGSSGPLCYGYPTGKANVGWSSIGSWVQMDGFTVAEDPNNFWTKYQLPSAPDPTNCYVYYVLSPNPNTVPTVTAVTGGC